MTLEERKNNTYFDKTGRQILPGDLLKTFHFISRNKTYYMYHVVVMECKEDKNDFPVLAIKGYYSDKPHCRLYVVCDNEQRMYKDAKIISEMDFQTKRQKIKLT